MRRFILTLLIGTACAVALAMAGDAHADLAGDEQRFVDLINQSRAAAGAGALAILDPIVSLGREHSGEMVETNSIWHTPNLAERFPPEWEALGENVGKAKNAGPDALHQAFMDSQSHRSNILNPIFNYVGVGVVFAPDGTLFVTEEFMKGPEGLQAQSAAPSGEFYPIPASEAPAVAGPASMARKDWYFAEGYTGPGFQEDLNILNPLGAGANVTITYLLPGGATKTQSVSVPASTRTTVNVNQAVGAGKEVSAVVKSDSPVVVERLLGFLYKGRWSGRTALIGSTAPATTFYFAEGYTGPNFEEYLTLANPQPNDVQATITYLFSDGTTQEQGIALAPNSRTTVDVNTTVGAGREVAVIVKASKGVMAERPMYFAFNAEWDGGHTSAGMGAPATSFTFAEGYTGAGFAEFLTLLNPGSAPANVSLTYLLDGGGTVPQQVTVGPRSRFTVSVNDVVPGREVSVDLVSNQPVVAERPMYFSYKGGVTDGHNVVGSTAPSRFWLFPGGDTRLGTDTYLTVANSNTKPVTYTVVFFDDQGLTTTRNFTVPARARQTVNAGPAAGSGRTLGAQLSATDPVVAEQPVYSLDPNGGSDVTGYPVSG